MHDVAPIDPELMEASPPECTVIVRDQQQEPRLHHFKVIELKSFKDTETASQVNVLFHFAFPKYQKHAKSTDEQYTWDIRTDPKQRLYLSQDTTKLMEVINNYIGTVYVRINIDEDGREIRGSQGAECEGQAVRWLPYYRIKQFPSALGTLTSVPYLFSPNFKY